jgi:hypothetical protein
LDLHLTTFDLTSRSDWSGALASFKRPPDIYFEPRYLAAYDRYGDGHATGVFVADGTELLYVPYLLSPIPGETGLYDVQGAYGYGGPVVSCSPTSEFLENAWHAIESVWREQGVVAAFLRLHPLVGNEYYMGTRWSVVADRPTISIDLRAGVEAAFAGAAGSNHRNMVKRALQLGMYAVCRQVTPESMRAFSVMYRETMTRLNANAYYFFDGEFFERLQTELGNCLDIIQVSNEVGDTRCMALIMYGPRWAHYYLSARENTAPNCSTNLLLQAASEAAQRRGLLGIHLGGGRTASPADSLLKFKERVGHVRHQFRTARLVIHPDRYSRLIQTWTRQHADAVPEWFLGYRQA